MEDGAGVFSVCTEGRRQEMHGCCRMRGWAPPDRLSPRRGRGRCTVLLCTVPTEGLTSTRQCGGTTIGQGAACGCGPGRLSPQRGGGGAAGASGPQGPRRAQLPGGFQEPHLAPWPAPSVRPPGQGGIGFLRQHRPVAEKDTACGEGPGPSGAAEPARRLAPFSSCLLVIVQIDRVLV